MFKMKMLSGAGIVCMDHIKETNETKSEAERGENMMVVCVFDR